MDINSEYRQAVDQLNQPEINTELCEVCLERCDEFEVGIGVPVFWKGKLIKLPHVCTPCIRLGDAKKFYLENGHSEEEISDWLKGLKAGEVINTLKK